MLEAQDILAVPQVRRTLKGVFVCAACLLLAAETE